MGNKKNYETPTVINISGRGVSGDISGGGHDQERGICSNGGAPYSVCHVGTDVASGQCFPGTSPLPGACSTGQQVDTWPQCKSGSNAIVGCTVGSHA